MRSKINLSFSSIPIYLLVFIRLLIGWFLLYGGIAKLGTDWSSAAYLEGSRWIFAPVFHWMAGNTGMIAIIDFINIWGMILIGIVLMLGLFTRVASACGAALLFFVFLAYPPIPGYSVIVPPVEGSYLWVNKNLIEFLVLMAFVFIPSDFLFGLDRLYKRWKEEKPHHPIPDSFTDRVKSQDRREVIRDLISLPVLGVFAYALHKKNKWDSYEEKLLQIEKMDHNKRETLLEFNHSTLTNLKGTMPTGIINYTDKEGRPAKWELSRLFMGGNLIGGFTHARDLIYVSKLVKTYHTDEKIMQTLALGEKCGMNAIISNPAHGRIFQLYKREFRSDLKFISDCGIQTDFQKGIAMSLASDFDSLYCQGEITDRWANPDWNDPQKRTLDQRMELIRLGLEEIRSHGKPAGIGAHKIEAIKVCVEYELKPDYWVKTAHNHDYWSAQHTRRRDSYFDYDPEETIRFMGTLKEPWIAFKVLAAGAIRPEVGLNYAFTNGADFVCLGMYDFQVVEDANLALDALALAKDRPRPWMA